MSSPIDPYPVALEKLNNLVDRTVESMRKNPEIDDRMTSVVIAAALQRAMKEDTSILNLVPGIIGIAIYRLAKVEVESDAK